MTKIDFVAQFEGQPVESVLAAAKKQRFALTRKQVHRIRFTLRNRSPKLGRKRKSDAPEVVNVGGRLPVIEVRETPANGQTDSASFAPSFVHASHLFNDKRELLRTLILDLGLDTARAVIQDLGAPGSSS
jgi:hypothetical protein